MVTYGMSPQSPKMRANRLSRANLGPAAVLPYAVLVVVVLAGWALLMNPGPQQRTLAEPKEIFGTRRLKEVRDQEGGAGVALRRHRLKMALGRMLNSGCPGSIHRRLSSAEARIYPTQLALPLADLRRMHPYCALSSFHH